MTHTFISIRSLLLAKDYNPDYHYMPFAQLMYGQPTYHTRMVCTARELGLKDLADKMQSVWDAATLGKPTTDLRGMVSEYTFPDDPTICMSVRMKTPEEIEVDVIDVSFQYGFPEAWDQLTPEAQARIAATKDERRWRNHRMAAKHRRY